MENCRNFICQLFLVMNLHAVQHLDKAGVAVVDNFAVAKVQLGNLRHIFLAELEIPNVDVLFHTVFMNGLGNYYDAPLHIQRRAT